MPAATFQGVRVLSLESRRATEAAKLIRTYEGEALVAPAMREVISGVRNCITRDTRLVAMSSPPSLRVIADEQAALMLAAAPTGKIRPPAIYRRACRAGCGWAGNSVVNLVPSSNRG